MECCKRLAEELTCSICHEYFKDPVMLDCGHNFCRTCLTNYWGESATDPACPQCRETLQVKRLKPNLPLVNMIEITKNVNHLLQHSFVFVEEAAQECKDEIRGTLKFLRDEREKFVFSKGRNWTESNDLLCDIDDEKNRTTAAFGDICQSLQDQEKLLLAQMDEVEKEITWRRDDHHTSLSAVLSSLTSLIQELEEKLKQSADEVVQNVWNVLDRCPKEPFNNPVVFPVALKWKAHDFFDISPFLEQFIKLFQNTLNDGLELKKVSVTLDPNTAHAKIILSKDCKNVRLGTTYQDLPNNPERFDKWCFVLGKETMITGRHFWEVTAGNEEDWSVGVARNNVKRKGAFDFCPCEGIWHLGMWNGCYSFSKHPEYYTLPLVQKLKKVRVTLNCAGRRVAFFDADTASYVHSYDNVKLPRDDSFLPFFYVYKNGQLSLCP